MDLYSFHTSKKQADETYSIVFNQFKKLFKKLNLNTITVYFIL